MKQLLTAILLSLVFVSSRGEDAAKWADLDRYAAANDSIIAAAAYPRVVLMGNSITEMWPVRNPHLFTSNPDIVGRGISGQTSYQMLLRFSNDVIALHPKIAVISAGTNDIAENTGKYDEERTMANIKAMADLARANGIKPVLACVLPAGGFKWRPDIKDAMEKIQSLNGRIKEYAVANGIYFVDYYTPMVNSDHTAMNPAFAIDSPGVHPNSDGYDIMEIMLLKTLKEVQ